MNFIQKINGNTHNYNINDNDMDGEEWEVEMEEFFRLKIDNIQKVKHKINSIIKLKSLKFKKIEEHQKIFLDNIRTYLAEQVYPSINNTQHYTDTNHINLDLLNNESNNQNLSKRLLSSINVENTNYNYIISPEVGTSLIFKLNNSTQELTNSNNYDLSYIGKSTMFFEATTKLYKPDINNVNSDNSMIAKKTKREIRYKIRQTKKKIQNNLQPQNIINSEKSLLINADSNDDKLNESSISNKDKVKINPEILKNRKKRKKLFSYKKNSTVIELKRVNKD